MSVAGKPGLFTHCIFIQFVMKKQGFLGLYTLWSEKELLSLHPLQRKVSMAFCVNNVYSSMHFLKVAKHPRSGKLFLRQAS